MQIVSANVWEMVAAILSGLVFVLLGLSLPNVIVSALRGQTGFVQFACGYWHFHLRSQVTGFAYYGVEPAADW